MTDDIVRNLGPLTLLAGVWEGDKGCDAAPSGDGGVETNKFRENMTFEPFAPVSNHEQKLYGLRYSTTAWRLGEDDPFHEELGYWLWDANEKQVLRCFIVPRGVSVVAGGTVEPDAKTFRISADAGSETYGVCSNQFLDREFKTVRFELQVTLHEDGSFSYEEDTQLKIRGQANLFHHTDKNTLRKIQ